MSNMVPPYSFPGQPMQAAQPVSPWSMQPPVAPAPWSPMPVPMPSASPSPEAAPGETVFRFAMEQGNQVVRYINPTAVVLLCDVAATLALDRNGAYTLKAGQEQDARLLLQLQCLMARGSGYALTVVGRAVLLFTQALEISHV